LSSSTACPPELHEALVSELDGPPACLPAPVRSAGTQMACTGIEFCKLAIVETKAPGR